MLYYDNRSKKINAGKQIKGDINMNTINSTQNTISAYAKNEKILKALEVAKVEEQKKVAQDDSIKISQQALQALGTTSQVTTNTTNPLDALVSAGTITQDQSIAIQSAFKSTGSAIKSSGVYSSKPINLNPLESLISAGTITQDQAAAVKSAFEASM